MTTCVQALMHAAVTSLEIPHHLRNTQILIHLSHDSISRADHIVDKILFVA